MTQLERLLKIKRNKQAASAGVKSTDRERESFLG